MEYYIAIENNIEFYILLKVLVHTYTPRGKFLEKHVAKSMYHTIPCFKKTKFKYTHTHF